LANVSRSYSKNNTGTVFLRHGVQLLYTTTTELRRMTVSVVIARQSVLN